jgi:hypothetical protein
MSWNFKTVPVKAPAISLPLSGSRFSVLDCTISDLLFCTHTTVNKSEYNFYLRTVQVVTLTLLKTNSCTYFSTFIFTLKYQKIVKKCSIKASYIIKNPTCFGPYSRTIFRGRPSLLVHLPRFSCTLHLSVLVCGRMPSVCICIQCTCLCAVWSCFEIDLEEVGYGGMDRIDLAQDRDRWRVFVKVVMNRRVS